MRAGRGYPIELALSGRRCVVIGGGEVAARKVSGLLEANAQVTVVAPQVGAEIARLDAVVVERRGYEPADLDGALLAFAATDDPELNRRVAADAAERCVLVNTADDASAGDFSVPARVRRGDVLVTFSTSGSSPALAGWLRRRFEGELGPELGVLAELLGEVREALLAAGEPLPPRVIWHDAIDSGMLELIRSGRLTEAKERLQACLSSSSD